MNLQQDWNKMNIDVTTAISTIKDLETRKEMVLVRLKDILEEKRRIDKTNMELCDKNAGRN